MSQPGDMWNAILVSYMVLIHLVLISLLKLAPTSQRKKAQKASVEITLPSFTDVPDLRKNYHQLQKTGPQKVIVGNRLTPHRGKQAHLSGQGTTCACSPCPPSNFISQTWTWQRSRRHCIYLPQSVSLSTSTQKIVFREHNSFEGMRSRMYCIKEWCIG